MTIAKDADAVAMRIAEIKDQLKVIEAALAKQMELPLLSRQRDQCVFLHIERQIFTARLRELEWMLYE